MDATLADTHLPRIALTTQQVTAVSSISIVKAMNIHFSEVNKLAERTSASARSGKARATMARHRFSHQSAMTIRKGNRHRYLNRLDGGSSLRSTSTSAADNAIA